MLVRTIAGLTLLALATPTHAQSVRPETFPAVGVHGFPHYEATASGAPVPMRRAKPVAEVTTWLPDSDPAVVAVKTADDAGAVTLDLAVDAAGKVVGCTAKQVYGAARLSEGLCDRVSARARLVPAIDDMGRPVADRFLFTVSFNRALAPRSPIVAEMAPSPSPPPPGGSWPPYADSLLIKATKLDLLAGGAASPQARAEPWTGIVYSPEAKGERCKIERSSGDQAFDKRACATAAKGAYDTSAATEPFRRRMPLHFVLADGKPRALVPVQKWVSRASAPESVRAAVAGELATLPADAAKRLRLDVMIDASGAATGCQIDASSGSDAGDVAACAAARKAGPYEPARDIFGRPFPARLYSWNPLAS